MLRHAKAVVDGRVATGGVETCCGPQIVRGDAGEGFRGFRCMFRTRNELAPLRERRLVATFGDKGFVGQSFRDHHVCQGIDHGHIGAGPQLQVMGRAYVRRLHQVDAPRVDDDESGALAQTALDAGGEHRVCVGGVRADHHDHVGAGHRFEVLRAGRCAQRLLETVSRGGVAHTGTSVDVVVAERGPHHLLHHVYFLVGAAGRDTPPMASRPCSA